MTEKSKFMLRAIELSIESAKTKGGPFGCVIVKDNKIIAEASPRDKIWGIGFDASKAIQVPKNKYSQNLLGKALMQVRNELK